MRHCLSRVADAISAYLLSSAEQRMRLGRGSVESGQTKLVAYGLSADFIRAPSSSCESMLSLERSFFTSYSVHSPLPHSLDLNSFYDNRFHGTNVSQTTKKHANILDSAAVIVHRNFYIREE